MTVGLRVVGTGFWFVASGALTLVRAGIELSEPTYYDPSSLLDYTAVVLTSAASSLRWSGLLILAAIAGSIFPDDGGLWLSGASFLGLGLWMNRVRAQQRSSGEVVG